MKKYLFTLAIIFISGVISSQTTTIVDEDFEDYTSWKYLVGQSDWILYDESTSISPIVANDKSSSGNKSILFDLMDEDAFLPIQTFTEDIIEVSFKMYMTYDDSGYVCLHGGTDPTSPRMLWIWKDANLSGPGYYLKFNGKQKGYLIVEDTWMSFRVKIDLTDDYVWIYANGSLINEGKWSGGVEGDVNLTAFGGINVWNGNPTTQPNKFYTDEYVVTKTVKSTTGGTGGGTVSVEEQDLDCKLKAYPNPTFDYVTVKSGISIKTISLFDVSGKHLKHIDVESFEHQLDLTEMQFGVYNIEVALSDGSVLNKRVVKR